MLRDRALVGEPKDPDSAHLVTLYEAFAEPPERAAFRADLRAGLGWGDAKQRVAQRIEQDLAPMRARYAELMAHPERIEETLLEGARKARTLAEPFLAQLREAVGLRRMVSVAAAPAATAVKARPALPVFKQYRESDGRFFFKLLDGEGRLLLQSDGFAQGKEAGQWVARLKRDRAAALAEVPAARGEGVSTQDVAQALAQFDEE